MLRLSSPWRGVPSLQVELALDLGLVLGVGEGGDDLRGEVGLVPEPRVAEHGALDGRRAVAERLEQILELGLGKDEDEVEGGRDGGLERGRTQLREKFIAMRLDERERN